VSEFGFGATTDVSQQDYEATASVKDWGFGDPTGGGGLLDSSLVQDIFQKYTSDSDYEDWGFGSPTPEWQVVPTLHGVTVFPDEGGALVRLIGKFSPVETYYVQLRAQDGTTTFPSAAYAYSGKAGDGAGLKAYKGYELLAFALPPVPTGIYDLLLRNGDNKTMLFEILKMIKVLPRLRAAHTYSLRSHYPQLYNVGPASRIVEKLNQGGTT
jgi:hypothetical protein